jgi:hypothetical protein
VVQKLEGGGWVDLFKYAQSSRLEAGSSKILAHGSWLMVYGSWFMAHGTSENLQCHYAVAGVVTFNSRRLIRGFVECLVYQFAEHLNSER